MIKILKESCDNINNSKKIVNNIKLHGHVYTPDYLVEDILEQAHYTIGNISKKNVIDNSCGSGQFLIKIIDIYCQDYLKVNKNINKLKNELEKYIHGIELDKNELNECIKRCNKVVEKYGIKNVNWDFVNGDALLIDKFLGKMDFVIGNPPYVRIHNLNNDTEKVKKYLFSNRGMTDLYITFYEIGIKMLNKSGILCYITPSSFFTSLAGLNMRIFLIKNQILESICDLKHFQPFDATTYTTIVCINKGLKTNDVIYFEFDQVTLKQKFIEKLGINNYFLNNNFYFSSVSNLTILKKILNTWKSSDIFVKNGYATLSDKIFISNFDFKSEHIIPVLKASKGIWTSIIYPYDKNGKLITEDELSKDKNLYVYMIKNKEKLLSRSLERKNINEWFSFGRSQAINDTFKNKLALNNLIRTTKDLKIIEVKSGCGIFSGLYITSDTISFQKIKNALLDDEFSLYISLLGKYKSGGYYTFSSKDIKLYLDYKLGSNRLFDDVE